MSSQVRHVTAPEDRVSWPQLAVYGLGGVIPIALFNSVGLLIGLLGNISLGLNAFLLGTIMIVPKLWDALADPFIGHFSDNTRTPWGRRRPYILVGGIAVALSFVILWWVPRGDSVRALFDSDAAYQWFHLAYILGALLLFYTAVSIFEIPHGALGMEMSGDYHERTRLFSAKSFLGNLFAMATPWMFALAEWDLFSGAGGDPIDGMRTVSLLVAVLLLFMAPWWFYILREPAFSVVKKQHKSTFWHDVRKTVSNRNFLTLVAIVFTLAMGFNFVQIFNYYITIFYLYAGDSKAAGGLLGWAGTTWAVTGLLAVFPLNWLSQWLGKNRTLLIAILLMCAAQLSKIVCYQPGTLAEFDLGTFGDSPWRIAIEGPYLVLIPTILLSAGMLMFFTLGSSMVGDVTDEDELKTGTRSEGSFYSVFWWFIQMGTAFASLVMGALLVFTAFNEQQNVTVEAMQGSIERIRAKAVSSAAPAAEQATQNDLRQQLERLMEDSKKLQLHFTERMKSQPDQAEHLGRLVEHNDSVRADAEALYEKTKNGTAVSSDTLRSAEALLKKMPLLRQQSPQTLWRLRVVEISVPLVLSLVSIFLTLRYPLTEARCYEIKEELKRRRANQVNAPDTSAGESG